MYFQPRTAFGQVEKEAAIAQLRGSINYRHDFQVLLMGSILIATGAIFIDSIAVLIASMIIAPLAAPILSLGLGIVAGKLRMIVGALGVLLLSCFFALAVAGLLTFFFGNDKVTDTYITFTSNREVAVVIALVAGFIGAYGMLSTKVASAVTGVAIAVSLMPPLVATSINYIAGDFASAGDAAVLFLLNVGGILVSSMVVFWWFGVGKAYRASKKEFI